MERVQYCSLVGRDICGGAALVDFPRNSPSGVWDIFHRKVFCASVKEITNSMHTLASEKRSPPSSVLPVLPADEVRWWIANTELRGVGYYWHIRQLKSRMYLSESKDWRSNRALTKIYFSLSKIFYNISLWLDETIMEVSL